VSRSFTGPNFTALQ